MLPTRPAVAIVWKPHSFVHFLNNLQGFQEWWPRARCWASSVDTKSSRMGWCNLLSYHPLSRVSSRNVNTGYLNTEYWILHLVNLRYGSKVTNMSVSVPGEGELPDIQQTNERQIPCYIWISEEQWPFFSVYECPKYCMSLDTTMSLLLLAFLSWLYPWKTWPLQNISLLQE